MQNIKKILEENSIYFDSLPHIAADYRELWENAFANFLTDDEKKKIFLNDCEYDCGYLWHLFSYELVPHFVEFAANNLFNNYNKKACYIFHQRDDEVIIVPNGNKLNSTLFAQSEDLYVVDENFTWTYVVPYDEELGYYYYRNFHVHAVKTIL